MRPLAVMDPRRAAREAEDRARREEREKFRAEEDARRAAQQADREARGEGQGRRPNAVPQIAESLRRDGATDMEGNSRAHRTSPI